MEKTTSVNMLQCMLCKIRSVVQVLWELGIGRQMYRVFAECRYCIAFFLLILHLFVSMPPPLRLRAPRVMAEDENICGYQSP
jgi:hypothetical protein